jgi:hypothetical protein
MEGVINYTHLKLLYKEDVCLNDFINIVGLLLRFSNMDFLLLKYL